MWYIQWPSLLLSPISCFKSTNRSPLSWSQCPYVGDQLHFELHVAKHKSHSNHGKCIDSWALTSESWQGDRASAFSQIHQEILMHLWGGSHSEELCSRTSVCGRLCESRNDGSFSHVNHDVSSAFREHAPDRAAGFGPRGAGGWLTSALSVGTWVMKAFGFCTFAWTTMVFWCRKARHGAPILLVPMMAGVANPAPAARGTASWSGWLLVVSLAAVACDLGGSVFPILAKVDSRSLGSLIPGDGLRNHSWKHNLNFVQLPLHTPSTEWLAWVNWRGFCPLATEPERVA